MAKSTPTKIAIIGADGKMGRTLISLALRDPSVKLVGALEQAGNATVGQDAGLLVGHKKAGVFVSASLSSFIRQAQVVIDFTTASATLQNVKECVKNKKAIVIGTTGFSAKQKKEILKLSKRIPILMAPNMSPGVNLLFRLAFLVGATLGDEYDVEITARQTQGRSLGVGWLVAGIAHAQQARFDGVAAIGHARGHHCQLQRRRQQIGLANAGNQRFAKLPGYAGHRQLPVFGRHQAGLLAGQPDVQYLTKPQAPGHVGDPIDPDFAGNIVEINVA